MANKTSPSTGTMKTKVATKKELSTNNYVAAVIVVTLLVVIICGFVGKGMAQSLIINTKLISGNITAKSDLNTKLTNIPILINNYQNLGNAKQLIADGLPNNTDFPQIVSIMQSLSNASGVTLTEVAPPGDSSDDPSSTTAVAGSSPIAAPNGATPYVFTVTVNGPYAQIVSFFQNLELSDRPMHVSSTQISGSNGTLTVDATIQTYYQAEASVSDSTETVK
jgi:Tfp pilus assembly protein PilO